MKSFLHSLLPTEHDIALLRLGRAIPDMSLDYQIANPDRACLPDIGTRPIFADCLLQNWGLMEGNVTPNSLQEVRLPILRCPVSVNARRIQPISPYVICAGNANYSLGSAQIGDFGGSLWCPLQSNSTMWTQVAIVSRPLDPTNARNGIALCTRISFYLKWIKSTVKSKW